MAKRAAPKETSLPLVFALVFFVLTTIAFGVMWYMQYSDQAGMPRRPHIEATLTIAGCSPCLSSGNACRMSSAGAKKFTSMIFRRTASLESAKCPKLPMPALFTSTSRPP